MDKLKQSLGFILLGTVVWLDFVLASQVGDLALMWINYWLLGLAFCAWIVSANLDLTSERAKKIKVWSSAMLVGAFFFSTRFSSWLWLPWCLFFHFHFSAYSISTSILAKTG